MVRVTGLEPARGCHQNLNLARLPIPPHPQILDCGLNKLLYFITLLQVCQLKSCNFQKGNYSFFVALSVFVKNVFYYTKGKLSSTEFVHNAFVVIASGTPEKQAFVYPAITKLPHIHTAYIFILKAGL